MSFSSFKFHPRIDAGVKALGFVTPTPIQAKGIPPIMAGKDLLGLAQTGTGKTAAFALPLLERLLAGPRLSVRALILAPTRELAEQIHVVLTALAPHTGIRSMTIYGGVGMTPQVSRLRAGVEIVVACPGRLLDHIKQRTINLSHTEVLVIDEADRMFDMGFLPDVRRIVSHLPKKRQTLLFSATMPDDIRKLIREILHNPETVQIGHAAPIATVEHAIFRVSQDRKTDLLLSILDKTETGSVLVFTRTKHRAKKIARVLQKEGFKTAELQGNLSQNRRQEALDGFRSGKYRILVATDIAARGIDVSTISHVINFDMPDTVDAYTHRIGRTGRMEKTGDAFTFVTHEDDDMVRAIEKVLKERLEERNLPGFDSSAPARRETRHEERPHAPAHRPSLRDDRGHARRDTAPRTGERREGPPSPGRSRFGRTSSSSRRKRW